ncbi:MAG TPA: hydroxymethylbilane synthase [Thermoanaerobaculia bacterium]|nr:hydroxymethylbilane synthase [Thermoanaerobaculia bacterium]
MTAPVRIGTRGSPLALWQANEVARVLNRPSEIVTIRTTGDTRTNVSLASIGGKGVFIKELEEGLLGRTIDLAVHSLKDVPSIVPPQFALAAFLARADPRDAWIQPGGIAIDKMRSGAKIGTSAPRRRAQLRALYPKFRVEDIRGNVDSRIRKLHDGAYDGAVLASAGLTRLGRASEITSFFSIEEMIPAAGQGIIAIETLAERAAEFTVLSHFPSALAALCERGVLQKFGDLLDCYSAVAVHATIDRGITVQAFFGEVDGDRSIRVQKTGPDADTVIDSVYEALVAEGAEDLSKCRR